MADTWQRAKDGSVILSLPAGYVCGVLGKGLALQLQFIRDEVHMREIEAKRSVPEVLQIALSIDMARDLAASLARTANEASMTSAKPSGPTN